MIHKQVSDLASLVDALNEAGELMKRGPGLWGVRQAGKGPGGGGVGAAGAGGGGGFAAAAAAAGGGAMRRR